MLLQGFLQFVQIPQGMEKSLLFFNAFSVEYHNVFVQQQKQYIKMLLKDLVNFFQVCIVMDPPPFARNTNARLMRNVSTMKKIKTRILLKRELPFLHFLMNCIPTQVQTIQPSMNIIAALVKIMNVTSCGNLAGYITGTIRLLKTNRPLHQLPLQQSSSRLQRWIQQMQLLCHHSRNHAYDHQECRYHSQKPPACNHIC